MILKGIHAVPNFLTGQVHLTWLYDRDGLSQIPELIFVGLLRVEHQMVSENALTNQLLTFHERRL